MLVLFADTDSDITPELAEELGYKVISMPYSTDGNTVYPYEDFKTFDVKPFYDMLRSGVIPTTSAISVERYKQYFEPVFANGDDILYVHFSRAMSATFEVMDKALEELKEKYPERNFYQIDTKGISILTLAVIYEVSDLVKAGKTPEEILEWASVEVDKFAVYFFADDLKFFKRSGRVSGLAATMGTLLGIRPIIYMNAEGKMVSIGKEKGRTKALERLLSYAEELGDNVKAHRVLIAHADAPEFADEMEALLKGKFGDDLNVIKVVVNPTIGCHCGPNSMGVCFHAVHR